MESSEYERVNYHTHCARCQHARGDVRDYAEEAVRKGLTALGFSDHLPYPDNCFGRRMFYAELEDYLEEITALKEEYREKLRILRGFEGEYITTKKDYYEWLLAHEKCDYLILGQHSLETADGTLYNVYELPDTELYETYAENIVEGMRTGYYRYAAHPDLVFINDHAWDIHCDRVCDIIINGALKYGFGLEYNANGLRRGKHPYVDGERYFYPHETFWERVRGTGISVYVGSDCHEPESLYDCCMEMSYRILKQKGIRVTTKLIHQ